MSPPVCPGALTTHAAADGALARVRLPGGVLRPDQLTVLAGCAADLGDGLLHLTSRANVQLRGLDPDTTELAARLWRAGLLPSPAHELVRNILASPLSGYLGGLTDVRELPAALDAALCGRPELAALPSRFLFALDDGRGDIAGPGVDLAWRATGPVDGLLVAGGSATGVPMAEAVPAMITAALAFLEGGEHAMNAPFSAASATNEAFMAVPPAPTHPIGILHTPHGPPLLSAGVPFGELPAGTAHLLAGFGTPVIITPWRSVLLPGVDDADRLADAGLIVDPTAPGLGITACIGLPGCARSTADVRADARRVAEELPSGVRAHFAGCERRCGQPRGDHVDVLADGDGDGYRVDGRWMPVDQLARKGLPG